MLTLLPLTIWILIALGLSCGLGTLALHLWYTKADIYLREGAVLRPIPRTTADGDKNLLAKTRLVPRRPTFQLWIAALLTFHPLFSLLTVPVGATEMLRQGGSPMASQPQFLPLALLSAVILIIIFFIVANQLDIYSHGQIAQAQILDVQPFYPRGGTKQLGWELKLKVIDPVDELEFHTTTTVDGDPGRFLDDTYEWVIYRQRRADIRDTINAHEAATPTADDAFELSLIDGLGLPLAFGTNATVSLVTNNQLRAYLTVRLIAVIAAFAIPMGFIICVLAVMTYELPAYFYSFFATYKPPTRG